MFTIHPARAAFIAGMTARVGDFVEGFADLTDNASRVVDKDVDPPEPPDQLRDLRGVREVGRVPIDAMDRRAVFLQSVRDRGADPMSRPCDERDAAAQLTHL